MTEDDGLALVAGRLAPELATGFAALHRQNRRLWSLEDDVRITEAADEIARLKRAIDETNLARHAAIGAIDAATLALYPTGAHPDDPRAVIDSSSVGQLLDRLSILALKRARIAAPPASALAAAHWDHVLACLDRALAALAAGRWVHHPTGEPKQYGAR